MALMQAARARTLGLPLESAYSWGLNRATFIAAAKRGFKGAGARRAEGSAKAGAASSPDVYFLGDDMAYKTEKDGVLLFTFGGEVQTMERFDRQVKSRFGAKFPQAWKEAQLYVKKFDKGTLESADDFYRLVYKPVRDDLAAKWTEALS